MSHLPNQEIQMRTKGIDANCVLCATDSSPVLYFESSAGEGKANYFTEKLEEAYKFSSVNEALTRLKALSNNGDVEIQQLIEVEVGFKLKVGWHEYLITGDDVFSDNGVNVQLRSQSNEKEQHGIKPWPHLSQKALKKIGKYERVYIDERLFRLKF